MMPAQGEIHTSDLTLSASADQVLARLPEAIIAAG
jgi:hypothetical protein